MSSIDEIIRILKTQHKHSIDEGLVLSAYEFSKKAHFGQKRRSGEPYISHPLAVAEYLARLNMDTDTIVAALLHDTCEDTAITPNDIEKNFGSDVRFLVTGVTKINKLKYHGVERTAENLRKMFLAIAEDIRVVIIKLVDRLHNMKTLEFLPPEKQKRIAVETLEIYAPLSYRLGIGDLKGQLEDLAFPYAYPKEHEWLIKNIQAPFEERKRLIEQLRPIIEEELKKEKIPYSEIHARAKHLYSLYKKLIKYETDINRVFDLVALRIIVPSIEACYGALGVVHKLWRPMPGLVKDYIALPKPNGYQSIHTTVFGPKGYPVEFQIRTAEMHTEAEFGIAAHWSYSEKKSQSAKEYTEKKASFANKKELAWVRQLHAWHKSSQTPEEFLESIKIDFFKNRIFALTPKGDVIDLPEGSTTIDFAYHIHTDIGHGATGAKVNGKIVPLSHALQNGDVIEIATRKNKNPNSDWLEIVKTSAARKHIHSRLNRAQEEKSFNIKNKQDTEIRCIVNDRVGLMKDISNIMTRNKINMEKIISDAKHTPHPIILIHCSIRSLDALKKVIRELKSVKGICEVNYKML
ncbi:MAG: RelA/SpoT family protein [Patescibacteria group bacterium]